MGKSLLFAAHFDNLCIIVKKLAKVRGGFLMAFCFDIITGCILLQNLLSIKIYNNLLQVKFNYNVRDYLSNTKRGAPFFGSPGKNK